MRLTNRLTVLALGVGLVAVGVIAGAEVVLTWIGRGPWIIARDHWDRSLARLEWDNTSLTRVSAVLVVGGALLCIVQLWPRRPTSFPLTEPNDLRRASIERRSLEERLQAVVLEDDEILGARVRAGRRRARVRVGVPVGSPQRAVKERLAPRVQGAMTAIGVARRLRPAVTVREDRRRRVR